MQILTEGEKNWGRYFWSNKKKCIEKRISVNHEKKWRKIFKTRNDKVNKVNACE